MKLKDIQQVNHLIEELGSVQELVSAAEHADPADLILYIKGPGDASIEMSSEGAASTHYRGFSAKIEFLAELKRMALTELDARRKSIMAELARLGVES